MSFRSLIASSSGRLCSQTSLQRRCSSSKSPVSQQIRRHILPHVNSLQTGLASQTRQALLSLSKRTASLGSKLNQLTGYEQVEQLKAAVAEQERVLQLARSAAAEAKVEYDSAVAKRSSAQREVNLLLERKHSWSDADVSSFTTLVRADHASTAEVVSSSQRLKEREFAVDKAFTDLTSSILHRYHEEQVWSDKIRSISTWANVIGLAFNFFIFLIAIAIVEPWKRRRLVERLEERTAGLMERVEGQISALREAVSTPPFASTSVQSEMPLGSELPQIPPPSPSLSSDLLSRYCNVDLSLSQTQSHLVGVAAGAIAGFMFLAVFSVCFR